MTTRSGIDLHAHTTASDGTYSPARLVDTAAELGLSALAVTDHDTLAGLPDAIQAAKSRQIELIPGIELSVEDEEGRYHLLGYGVDPQHGALQETLVTVRAKRAARNELIIRKAADLDLPITWDDVVRQAGDGGEVIARPHFAAALLEKGVVLSIKEAFDRFLAAGRPLYFAKDGLTSQAAIALIHDAGGIAVFAHPGLSKWSDPAALAARLAWLKAEAGLDGVEAYYNKHSEAQTREYLDVASRVNLLTSGGSDFHGDAKPDVRLGDVYRGQPAPERLLSGIKEAIGAVRAGR